MFALSRVRRAVVPLALFSIGACGSDSSSPPELSAPAKLVLVSGDAQTVSNGPAAAALPLVVRITDPKDRPVSGIVVTWAASDPTAKLSATSTNTDASGQAQVTWTVGQTAGAQTVTATTASLAGARVVFQGTNLVTSISGGVTIAPALPLSFSRSAPLVPGPRFLSSRSAAAVATNAAPTRRLIVTFRATALDVAGGASGGVAAFAARAQSMHRTLAPRLARGLITREEGSPAINVSRVTVPAGVTVGDAIAALRSDPAIASVTVDSIVPMLDGYTATEYQPPAPPNGSARGVSTAAAAVNLPNNPLLLAQYWHYNMIDAPRAWTTTTGSAAVLVAVVDNGIRFDHPSIAANLTKDGYNFVTGGNRLTTPMPLCAGGTTLLPEAGYGSDPTEPDDLSFNGQCWWRSTVGNHGLHVAGTIGAVGNNGIGATGINWNVRIRPIRVLDITGSGSYYDIAQGVLYAAGLPASDGNGGTVTAPTRAALINMSLGGTSNSSVLASAISAATAAGSLVIAAAGNSESSLPLYPAAYPDVVAVVALGPDLQLASYTSIGSTVSLAAPGGNFRSSGSAGVASTTWNFQNGTPSYAYYEGTSMAAPHVTGVAALVLAANPGLSGVDLRNRLQSTAIHLGAPGHDDRYGYGLVNAYNAVNNITSPQASAYVRVVDASTGDTVRSVPVGADGSYSVQRIAPGNYYVVAGEDAGGDQRIGVPGRRFGWYGGSTGPSAVSVGSGKNQIVAVNVGTPVAGKPDGSIAQANQLVMNSYVLGQITAIDPADVFRIQIPRSGTYYFETSGVIGTCAYGIELNTVLDLLSSTGTVLATNDDVDMPGSRYCSQITMALQAGTYYVRVRGSGGSSGQYRLWVHDS